MKSFLIAANFATNSVAASTAVELDDAAFVVNGIAMPATGFSIPAVLAIQMTLGATPGNYTIEVEQSDASDGTYTNLQVITQATSATATGEVLFYNVTVDPSKPFIRVNVADATANAGTVTVYLLA
jgi:hypothetical protein